jgi:hypothetical protein
MKRWRLYINENYRGVVVRKVKSMDRDRIRLFLMVACTGMRHESSAQGRQSRQ